METAITARLYFVLFSGAANSNNKLSPILPLQPELYLPPTSFARSLRHSRQWHHPFIPSPLPHLRFPPPCPGPDELCSLPSSSERFVVPKRAWFLSSSRFAEIHPDLATHPFFHPPACPVFRRSARFCPIAPETVEFLLSARRGWREFRRVKLFDERSPGFGKSKVLSTIEYIYIYIRT